jgi:hypothetical protein
MLNNIFIFIVIITFAILFCNLCYKYKEGLTCGDPAINAISAKVKLLNKEITIQSSKMATIKNTLSDILARVTNFKFSKGTVTMVSTGGPSLDISGNFPNIIFNLKLLQPPEGDKGYTGRVGKYGPPGGVGKMGDKGPIGNWGGLQ